jgi:hypothetical protein
MPEEGNRSPICSNICRNLMAHTDKMRQAMLMTSQATIGSPLPTVTKKWINPTQPTTKSIQTTIDARVLNTGGIFSLLSGFLPLIQL